MQILYLPPTHAQIVPSQVNKLLDIPWGQSNDGTGIGGLMAFVGPWYAARRLIDGFVLNRRTGSFSGPDRN